MSAKPRKLIKVGGMCLPLLLLMILTFPAVLAGCESETTSTSGAGTTSTTTSAVSSSESTAPPTTTPSSTVSSTPSTSQPAGAYTPKQGSIERKAMMDALRVATDRSDWIFVVVWLKADGDWAYAHVRPQTSDSTQNFEDLHALLKRSGTTWAVLKLTGGDEVPEGESPANLLKDLYPESPSDIYP